MTLTPKARRHPLWPRAAVTCLPAALAWHAASAQPIALPPPTTAGRSVVATPLHAPPVPPGSPSLAYLQAARSALARGQTGEAQEALERAETRLLDRPVDPAAADRPDTQRAVLDIGVARQALAGRDRFAASRAIDDAMAAVEAPPPVAAAVVIPPVVQPVSHRPDVSGSPRSCSPPPFWRSWFAQAIGSGGSVRARRTPRGTSAGTRLRRPPSRPVRLSFPRRSRRMATPLSTCRPAPPTRCIDCRDRPIRAGVALGREPAELGVRWMDRDDQPGRQLGHDVESACRRLSDQRGVRLRLGRRHPAVRRRHPGVPVPRCRPLGCRCCGAPIAAVVAGC